MNTKAKVKNFNEDLGVLRSEIRAVLDHWGLKDWQEYLVVRKAGCPDEYTIIANPEDEGDFAERLMLLHQQQAKAEAEHG